MPSNLILARKRPHKAKVNSFSSRTSEEPHEFHSWINIVIPSDGGKSQASVPGAQRVFSWEIGALPSGPSAGPTSWRVPGTSPGLLAVYVESVVLKSDLIRALMNALGIQSSR